MTAQPKPKSVLIIGSGPVIIGQAAEFDYAGTQACRALRDEGVRTILLNSNPATIMTDPGVADVVYLEPLTVASVEKILEREKPDGILSGLGGQTALNLCVALAKAGVLDRHPGTRLLGTPLAAIEMAEDRQAFRALLNRIGQPYPPSVIVEGATPRERQERTRAALAEMGLPAVIRPAFTLGGSGGGIVATEADFLERVRGGLRASPIGQVIVEKYLDGWQEVEYEVMRDAADTCICVCSMENVDPLGVHTGDSIVVAPVQTLSDATHQRLRTAALTIIRALGVEGGCNVQFALSSDHTQYAVIEVNPRVSRSSALASKATGYPIARVAAQIAVGRRLDEIPNAVTGKTVAAFEPALDYVVVKLPRFPFDKFPSAERGLGSQMKATGEVMAIERNFGAALNKALRGLEQGGAGWLAEHPDWSAELDALAAYPLAAALDHLARQTSVKGAPTDSQRRNGPPGEPNVGPDAESGGFGPGREGAIRHLERSAHHASFEQDLRAFLAPSDSRLWRLIALLRRGVLGDVIRRVTGIAPWFVAELERLIVLESRLRAAGRGMDDELLVSAKRAGFGDRDVATLTGIPAEQIRGRRDRLGLHPGFAMVDTSAAEFAAETPYFYSTYAAAGSPPEAPPVARPASLVIGSGPVRIGQGIEFDYCAVQASEALRRLGHSSIMVNSNPETVSTDFDASSRLYFESLDAESVAEVLLAETVDGAPPDAFIQFGGQTPLGLAPAVAASGARLRGLDLDAIDQTEERMRFAGLVDRLGIPQPQGGMASSVDEAYVVAERVGYPVIVRPSFVIGGLAVDFAYGPDDLARIITRAVAVDDERPVRIDAYLEGLELDVDAISDGVDVLIPGLMEHVERAGVHSGDSIGVYPPQHISAADQALVVDAISRVALAIGVRGLINGQFIVRDDGVYLLEVNPRASRTVPFMSKVTGVPMVELATRVALGETLAAMGWPNGLLAPQPFVAVKAPVFSTMKLRGVDPMLGPAMQSTGEVIGIHGDSRVALAKALGAASLRPPIAPDSGAVALLSLADHDKVHLAELAARLARGGYSFCATHGTAVALRVLGHEVEEVARVGEEAGSGRSVLDAVRSGEVLLVVNTPSPESRPMRDAGDIRRAALAEGILCLTSVDTALAASAALDPSLAERLEEVRPLGEWLEAGATLAK
ncbi:MAG: carbamoyl-phosphate synthase large subunit [Chloroflexota bacterium]|nr:carbamoyl-phosphate synthase large subunit [Chloroflexota bacterium]